MRSSDGGEIHITESELRLAPDPYGTMVQSEPGVQRIVRGVNHGHEVWEDCELCVAEDVTES